MKFIINQNLPKDIPFDYQYLVSKLDSYKYPRDKISLMLKNHEIIRVKKGLYIVSEDYDGNVDKNLIANLIYGPSYVSLDSALSYWGLIPERVIQISSVTNRKNKEFDTPKGNYSYRYQNNAVVSVGVERIKAKGYFFLIASKEKALLDKIATTKKLEPQLDFRSLIEEDFRIDMDEFEDMDSEKINNLSKYYRKRSVIGFASWYKKEYS
jgi:hypothetical protein